MSTQEEEESRRVSMQVTSLSTRLIESIEKQGELEGQIAQLEKDKEHMKSFCEEMQKKMANETAIKRRAEEEVSNLQKEVEELSSSLFDEANKMVSEAKREMHEIQQRNNSLVSQLKEKDSLLDNLQNQLSILKDVLHKRDRDQSTASLNQASTASSSVTTPQAPILYSPTANAVRYDLKLFAEYKKFTRTVKNIDSIKDTETKFIKRLLTDDIEPCLRLENAHGISWLNRRSLMSYLMDGRVSIEPVSGINETYRVNFQQNKIHETDVKSSLYSYPPHSPPVAIDQPCAFCGEERDDILEHSRLYVLKVHSKSESTLSLQNSAASPTISSQHPLCSYCLFRVRSSCDLFAFLRSLKTDVWKLEDDAILKKSWMELSRLRSKLFWAKVGIWDLDANIVTTRITPSMDDTLYASVLTTVDNSRISASSSVDSLPEQRPDLKAISETRGYISSPLINESKHNLGTPDDDGEQQIENGNGEHSPEDAYDDILDTYSQDGEQSGGEDTIRENTKGLAIQTEVEARPQDALLYSGESTPVIAASASTFPSEDTTTSAIEVAETPENAPSTEQSSDEDKFVDA